MPLNTSERINFENPCIAKIMREKVIEDKVVSTKGLVNACKIYADYWVTYKKIPPKNYLPNFAQVNGAEMREIFYGEW